MMSEYECELNLCTAFFPPIAYFAAMVQAGRFAVSVSETYARQTFRNRAVILTSQGPLSLSVPCSRPDGNHTPTSRVMVTAQDNWRRNHWRSIVTAYNSSPYFLYYRDGIEELFSVSLPVGLADYNTRVLDYLIRILKLPVERVPAEPLSRADAGVGAGVKNLPLNFTPKAEPLYEIRPYIQTFPSSFPSGHLSILDLLFNCGPEAVSYLQTARLRTPA